jgi:hypothetical protein
VSLLSYTHLTVSVPMERESAGRNKEIWESREGLGRLTARFLRRLALTNDRFDPWLEGTVEKTLSTFPSLSYRCTLVTLRRAVFLTSVHLSSVGDTFHIAREKNRHAIPGAVKRVC